MLAVWTILIAGGALGSVLSLESAVLVAFGLATAAALAWIPVRLDGAQVTALVAGLLAGYASLPAWSAAVAGLGGAFGLAARPGSAPGTDGPEWWLASVVLAPVFEELVYRERLLGALRARAGAGLALVLASALYALPHVEPWNVLGTFLVGLGLGGVRLAGGRIGLCIGIHAGLNLAILGCGAPPVRACLPPATAACVGIAVLLVALAHPSVDRASRLGRRLHSGPESR